MLLSRSLSAAVGSLSRYLTTLLVLCAVVQDADASNDLRDYVAAPDASYSWREIGAGNTGSVEYVEAVLTSQTWRGIPWKHQLFVIRPRRLNPSPGQGFLFIDGGHWDVQYESRPARARPEETRNFAQLANALRAPLVIVRQVPFEPLFGRSEDALIAYSFEQYFNTGQRDWPLLLPMVKSAARAMDAAQQILQQRWRLNITKFTVSGASKRGWTSWLIAAADSRVASVAPMVIDMLNIPAQLQLQRVTFGGLSKQIHDYEEIGLPDWIDTPAGRELVSMVDPYSYRESLTQPKLVLLGTNDPYWPLDALKVYWDGLPEEKRVLYLANQTHSLRDTDRLIGAVAALYRYSAAGRPLPQVSGTFALEPRLLTVRVRTDRRPQRLLSWSAGSPTRDFRKAHWSPRPCETSGSDYLCRERVANDQYTALYAEAVFEDSREPAFSLSTTVCIAGGPEPNSNRC